MTKAAALLTTTLFLAVSTRAQSLCEPFYVIGETNKGKVWEAAFQNCIDPQAPLIKTDENPQIRAQIISNRRIRRIISKQSKDSLARAEQFDNRGYTVSVDSADNTSYRLIYQNTFTDKGLLSEISYRNESLKADETPNSKGWIRSAEKFTYDSASHLILKREITSTNYRRIRCVRNRSVKTRRGFRLIPSLSVSSERAKYDAQGNIVKLNAGGGQSSYAFTYDSQNRLSTATDLIPYAVNVGTSVFAYNEQNLPTTITTTFRDKSYGFDLAKLEYDSSSRLLRYTMLQKGTTPYTSTTFEYSSSMLSSITIWISPRLFTTRKFYYNPSGLIRKIEYYNNDKLFSWTDYSYEFF
ncbi:RHS repeat domain-containing protein [Hymenobacter saemangeumensis]|uniref:RHS repeat domain-containing protein n=1 Tax=Hymenobacter saemangeumensis TaxID=1084522 RepID=UPI0031EDCDC5